MSLLELSEIRTHGITKTDTNDTRGFPLKKQPQYSSNTKASNLINFRYNSQGIATLVGVGVSRSTWMQHWKTILEFDLSDKTDQSGNQSQKKTKKKQKNKT